MTTSHAVELEPSCFQFTASFLPCMILHIYRYDVSEIEQQLINTIRRAPNLFNGALAAIDLDKIKNITGIDFLRLKHLLIAHHLVPIGIRGGSQAQQEAAIMDGFIILPPSKLNTEKENHRKTQDNTISKLITTPIRSGMQVYAKGTDLVVTAAVSAGAELFADGNIHIYGPLRGRAFAGVQGNTNARIFCRTLDAELLSIAGYYLTKEDMLVTKSQEGMIQIFLENSQIRMDAI